jgi:hypothetical protein
MGGCPRALALLLALLGSACGVPGRPLPPGPVPPAASPAPTLLSTPEGIEARAETPRIDVDGQPVGDGLEAWFYVDRPTCDGRPDARGPAGAPVVLPAQDGPLSVRVVHLRDGRAGPASPPAVATWTAPPPPPDAPLAFATPDGRVELTWLPPPEPITRIRIERDGATVTEQAASEGLYTDSDAPPGDRVYRLVGLGDTVRTTPSKPATVQVPERPTPPPALPRETR